MINPLADTLWSVAFLIIGMSLIVFRKRIVKSNLKRQYRHAKHRDIEELRQAKDLGLMPGLLKFQEVCYTLVGFVVIVICLQELFLPQAFEYINTFMGLFVLSIFAICGAMFFAFFDLYPLLWRKVDKCMMENHAENYQKAHSLPAKERIEFIKTYNKKINDPILRKLQIRAIIYTVVWFVIFYIMLMFILYMAIKITS